MTRDARGRIRGRDKSRLAAVFAAVSGLPGYEVTGEYTPDGWQVRYVYRDVATPEASWAIARRALRAANGARP